ncbi:MAG: hypothetical protein AAF901_09430 [Bacteroidota bacterium]
MIYTSHTLTPGISREAIAVTHAFAASQSAYFSNSIFNMHRHHEYIKKQFEDNKANWLEDTMFVSSSTEIFNNSFYQNVINLGEDAIPYMVIDMKENLNHWFYALSKITNVNPVVAEHAGNVELMADDWYHWAIQTGRLHEN